MARRADGGPVRLLISVRKSRDRYACLDRSRNNRGETRVASSNNWSGQFGIEIEATTEVSVRNIWIKKLRRSPRETAGLATCSRSDGFLPELDGAVEPSFRACIGTETEAVTDPVVSMELHVCPGLA
jgi:hypothetical protein